MQYRSTVGVGAFPRVAPLSAPDALDEPELRTVFRFNVDDNSRSTQCSHLHRSKNVRRLYRLFSTSDSIEVSDGVFTCCANWPFSDQKKVFNSRICFFVERSHDVGNYNLSGIQLKCVGRSDSERQSPENRIRGNRKCCCTLCERCGKSCRISAR